MADNIVGTWALGVLSTVVTFATGVWDDVISATGLWPYVLSMFMAILAVRGLIGPVSGSSDQAQPPDKDKAPSRNSGDRNS